MRRLGGSRAGFLAAARTGELGGFEPAGMTRHDLAMLDPEAALTLLRARFPMLAPRVRRRLLDEAQGNPLALLELPPALSGPQRAAWQALPAVLPLTDRLQAVFARRVSEPRPPLASCCCWPSWRAPPTMRCSIRPSAANYWSAWPRPSGPAWYVPMTAHDSWSSGTR